MPLYSDLGLYGGPSTSSYSSLYYSSPYSNHSSLISANYRSPVLIKPLPRSFSRGYKPHLATITESQGLSPLRRKFSPQLLLQHHNSSKYKVQKPININTADIDVSVNKYRKYDRKAAELKKPVEKAKSPSPAPSAVERPEKPEEEQDDAMDGKPGIRRDRALVRLHTVHKKDSPRRNLQNGDMPKSWRQNFYADELKEKEKRLPRRTPGELLVDKFLIRTKEEEDRLRAEGRKLPSVRKPKAKESNFHKICRAISAETINENLNPGQPDEVVRRQSKQMDDDLLNKIRRNSCDILEQENPDQEEDENNNTPAIGEKRKKKVVKKKSNEKLVLEHEPKSTLQRRPTQKIYRRTSTDSSLHSDLDEDAEKAYQVAIRDISQVEVEEIKLSQKPRITATVDVDESPTLIAVIEDMEIVESPSFRKPKKFKFNVTVEEVPSERNSLDGDVLRLPETKLNLKNSAIALKREKSKSPVPEEPHKDPAAVKFSKKMHEGHMNKIMEDGESIQITLQRPKTTGMFDAKKLAENLKQLQSSNIAEADKEDSANKTAMPKTPMSKTGDFWGESESPKSPFAKIGTRKLQEVSSKNAATPKLPTSELFSPGKKLQENPDLPTAKSRPDKKLPNSSFETSISSPDDSPKSPPTKTPTSAKLPDTPQSKRLQETSSVVPIDKNRTNFKSIKHEETSVSPLSKQATELLESPVKTPEPLQTKLQTSDSPVITTGQKLAPESSLTTSTRLDSSFRANKLQEPSEMPATKIPARLDSSNQAKKLQEPLESTVPKTPMKLDSSIITNKLQGTPETHPARLDSSIQANKLQETAELPRSPPTKLDSSTTAKKLQETSESPRSPVTKTPTRPLAKLPGSPPASPKSPLEKKTPGVKKIAPKLAPKEENRSGENFWEKIGTRESVYLDLRRRKLQEKRYATLIQEEDDDEGEPPVTKPIQKKPPEELKPQSRTIKLLEEVKAEKAKLIEEIKVKTAQSKFGKPPKELPEENVAKMEDVKAKSTEKKATGPTEEIASKTIEAERVGNVAKKLSEDSKPANCNQAETSKENSKSLLDAQAKTPGDLNAATKTLSKPPLEAPVTFQGNLATADEKSQTKLLLQARKDDNTSKTLMGGLNAKKLDDKLKILEAVDAKLSPKDENGEVNVSKSGLMNGKAEATKTESADETKSKLTKIPTAKTISEVAKTVPEVTKTSSDEAKLAKIPVPPKTTHEGVKTLSKLTKPPTPTDEAKSEMVKIQAEESKPEVTKLQAEETKTKTVPVPVESKIQPPKEQAKLISTAKITLESPKILENNSDGTKKLTTLDAEVKKVEDAKKPAEFKKAENVKKDDVKKTVEVKKTEDLKVPVEVKKAEDVKKPIELKKIEDVKKPVGVKEAEDVKKPVEVKKVEDVIKPVGVRKAEDVKKPIEVKKSEDVKKPVDVKKIEDVKKPIELKKIEDVEKPVDVKEAEDVKKPVQVKKVEDVIKPIGVRKAEDVKKPIEVKKIEDVKKAEDEKKTVVVKKVEDVNKPDDGKKTKPEPEVNVAKQPKPKLKKEKSEEKKVSPEPVKVSNVANSVAQTAELNEQKLSADEQKKLISKRSLVNKSGVEDPDLNVFAVPPTPPPPAEKDPSPPEFIPLQSNRITQWMHPFKKPEQFDECPVQRYARPKTIRHRYYPRQKSVVTAAESSEDDDEEEESEEEEESSEAESSEGSGSGSKEGDDDDDDSEESVDFEELNDVWGYGKVGASTSSDDSGFDSSTLDNRKNKDCDVNCHKKCEKLTANLCGVNQKLIVEAIESVKKGCSERDSPTSNPAHNPAFALDPAELAEEFSQSSTFAGFQKSGRITPPATTIPRFRKYNIEDFNFLKVLGKGSFGKVLLAELKDTEYYYAIKCLKKDVVLEDDDVECTLIERKVLALGTKHPYLCHLLCTFQTESHLFFVMEYLNGGDLMFHIQKSGRFPEPMARFYAAEIVSGLKFLHSKGIVYRDLKLDNILLDFDGHVRIADFGMCKLQIFLDRTADTFCGTPDYMAPEIIKGQHYNQNVDWWSFGVLLYEMLIGQSPFSGCDEDELFWSICNERPVLPRFLSKEASNILTLLLEKDATKRLGNKFCQQGDVKEQPFFHPVDWELLNVRKLEPPFKPNLQHPLDTQYFDRTFTVEKAKLTPIEQNILQSMDQTQFQGFSYTNPNATDR